MVAIQDDKVVKDAFQELWDSVSHHYRILPKIYMDMDFSEWLQLSEIVKRERYREMKAAMKNAAFSSWLLGAGEKKTFNKYLIDIGLEEKTVVITKDHRKSEIKRAYDIANRVNAKFRRRGERFTHPLQGKPL